MILSETGKTAKNLHDFSKLSTNKVLNTLFKITAITGLISEFTDVYGATRNISGIVPQIRHGRNLLHQELRRAGLGLFGDMKMIFILYSGARYNYLRN